MSAIGFGLGLSLSSMCAQSWPEGAVSVWDFANDIYMANGIALPRSSAFSFSRASSRLALNGVGNWTEFVTDVPAITDRGIASHPALSYASTNSEMSDAVVGAIGSGGALPTGYGYVVGGDAFNAFDSIEVVAFGMDSDGLSFITLDVVRDNSAKAANYPRIYVVNRYGLSPDAFEGEIWTEAMWYACPSVAGDDTVPTATGMNLQPVDASSASIGASAFAVLPAGAATEARYSATVTMPATSATIEFTLYFIVDAGEKLNRRITFKMPTLTNSSYVPIAFGTGSGGAADRSGDALVQTDVSWLSDDMTWIVTWNSVADLGSTRTLFELNDGTTANRIGVHLTTGGQLQTYSAIASSLDAGASLGGLDDGGRHKAAISYDRSAGDWRISVDGATALESGGNAILPFGTVSQLNIACNSGAVGQLGGVLESLIALPGYLSASALESLSG